MAFGDQDLAVSKMYRAVNSDVLEADRNESISPFATVASGPVELALDRGELVAVPDGGDEVHARVGTALDDPATPTTATRRRTGRSTPGRSAGKS